MSSTVQIKINVFKECITCNKCYFLDDWATGKCSLTDGVIIENAFEKNRKEKEPCDNWEFNYELLDECNFIDLDEKK